MPLGPVRVPLPPLERGPQVVVLGLQPVEPGALLASAEFVAFAREVVARRIPGLAAAAVAGSRSCLYESTPDRDFILDRVPGSSRVRVAGGGSGHGFKFGGAIGPLIADVLEDKGNALGATFRPGARFAAGGPPRPCQ